jgi:ArsR family transcriptional regulator
MRDSSNLNKRLYEIHAQFCSTLSNPVRLQVIDCLREEEKSVGELARMAKTSQANMSQHLTVMRQRGIVKSRKKGATVYYQLTNPKILKAFDLLKRVLYENLKDDEELVKTWSIGSDYES